MLKNKQAIKILISDTAPLFPPLWGGPKRIWNLYSKLSQELFDITYVGVDFRLGKESKYSFNKIRDNFREILCAFPPHYYFWNLFEKSIFKDNSFDLFLYLWMHTDWQFKYILDSFKSDVLICSHPWSSLSVKKNNVKFLIYDAHNCEYLLMNQILGKHWLKKAVLRRVKKIEADACRKSDLILVCSEKEKKDFMDLYNIEADKIIIIANGTNIIKDDTREAKTNYRKSLSLSLEDKIVVFIGAYYKPNIDAARFIIERIAKELIDFKFLIVGTVLEAFREEHIPSNVKLLGWIPDEHLDLVLRAPDIAINPMFDGSGVNIKMLDYMSYGLPIVTSGCGARGIDTFGRTPMIVSSIHKFIDNIKLLSNDSALRQQLSEDARSLVAEHYDWKKISQRLQDIILDKL